MSKAKTLKDKQRKIRSTFPDGLGLRVHRSISWLIRAEKEAADLDVCFILLWISFNSAYASDIEESDANERASFKKFFSTLTKLDNKHRVYDAVWTRFSQEIRILLDNKYIFGLTCPALFVPSGLIETDLDKELGHAEEETDAGADCAAAAADRGCDVSG